MRECELTWDDPSRSILQSGWTPFSSGSFSISEEVCSSGRPRVVMIYEDLRPGGMACCLFSLPPLIVFAPIFCPILSATSKAYLFSFEFNPKTQYYDLVVRSKAFACRGERCQTFSSLTNIRLEVEHKAHTSANMDSWDSSYSTSQVTFYKVIVDYEDGYYTLPPLPQDDVSRLQALVARVVRLVRSTCCQETLECVRVEETTGGIDLCPIVVPIIVVGADCLNDDDTTFSSEYLNHTTESKCLPPTATACKHEPQF